jgi:hypothetical protein
MFSCNSLLEVKTAGVAVALQGDSVAHRSKKNKDILAGLILFREGSISTG